MTRTMEGMTALITGGGGHIGRATGAALAAKGCNLAVLDKADASVICKDMANAHGIVAAQIDCDLMDPKALETVPNQMADQFGGCDALVNNAAFYDDMPGWGVPFGQEGYDAWVAVMRVNLLAPFFLAQSLAPQLKASGKGAIVNVASIYGVVGPDHSLYAGTEMTNPAAYAASKGGLIAVSQWLSTVMAPDVRVNTVTPGGVARGQLPEFVARYEAKTPLGRMATEGDVSYAIAMLLDPGAGYITGQNLLVDGGWTAW
jgi:NAD(P)-dependent dehydrogenase (short-subunit alcohol dehydrogenase family)